MWRAAWTRERGFQDLERVSCVFSSQFSPEGFVTFHARAFTLEPSSHELHLEQCRWSRADRRSRAPRVAASETVDEGAATDTVLAHSWMERRKDDAPRKVVRHTRGQKSVGRMFTQRVGNWTATAPADGVMFIDQLRSPALISAHNRSASPDFTDFCNPATTHLTGPRRGQVLDGGWWCHCGWRQVGPLRGSVFSARRV